MAHAQEDTFLGIEEADDALTGIGSQTGLDQASLPVIIGNIINVVLGLLGIILVVLLIYGGFLWMTAGGGETQITKAKKIIFNSIIGLVITIAAYAISSYVISAIVAAATTG